MILPAGSPTETLLRLLLPLNDKVQWTSHNVAGSEPAHVAAIPNTSPDHSIGRSDRAVCTKGRDCSARAAQRTSKGITDLLLPQTSRGLSGHSPSKKLAVEGYLHIAI
ncbi:hypothetical protein VNO78_38913 [Psophocarpus tetragonolobus]|uniref:Uncharacterized protein n=1 Tax=Psophocarpus tetragonolobus TaxID=3891 RepID=A0AAN9RGT2_PSOTE